MSSHQGHSRERSKGLELRGEERCFEGGQFLLCCNHRCVRITDTGLSYLSTMSSLRSLYLRWCCQVLALHAPEIGG